MIANGRFYGGRFSCAPLTRLEDPLLYACLFRKPGAWNALRYALALGGDRLWRLPDVSVLPAREVRIEGPEGDPLQGDGDIIARLPCTITLLPAALRLVVPAAG